MKKVFKRLSPAMTFIILLGIVSLFSDITHEGAASIRGAYLSLLGASATTIGFVSGLGELLGYSLRFVFGLITDRTKKYWQLTIFGYAVDVLAVPALALVHENGWQWACFLLILERTGKAIKKPAKNTIVSFAASQEGAGKSFAIQETLDQLGAFLGPVLLFAVMQFKTGTTYEIYTTCFAVLVIPALFTLSMLFVAKRKFPHPERFEPETKKATKFRLRPSFGLYVAAISLFAFGFIDFSLVTMHVTKQQLFTGSQLPLLYAGAMIIDAVAALLFGLLYDKKGLRALVISTALSSLFAIFIFGFHSRGPIILGVLLWGIGMGAQESIFKAVVTNLLPKQQRAFGYGLFEFSFGIFWFLGSWLVGALYDISLPALIVISVAAQLLSIPLYFMSTWHSRQESDMKME
ncbi:MAG TPA: MFS transporter [Clostridiaceae bacterium]|nr:MFS transporter [Clostridiaceae bacterium]